MFGFLISVAFTATFAGLDGFDKSLYATAVVLGAATTGVLIGTVALHIAVSGHHIKPQLIRVTDWLFPFALVLLGCTIVCALLLLLRVALDDTVAGVATGAVAAWFVFWWLALPVLVLRRAQRIRGDRP
jgi:hypothetical protein